MWSVARVLRDANLTILSICAKHHSIPHSRINAYVSCTYSRLRLLATAYADAVSSSRNHKSSPSFLHLMMYSTSTACPSSSPSQARSSTPHASDDPANADAAVFSMGMQRHIPSTYAPDPCLRLRLVSPPSLHVSARLCLVSGLVLVTRSLLIRADRRVQWQW